MNRVHGEHGRYAINGDLPNNEILRVRAGMAEFEEWKEYAGLRFMTISDLIRHSIREVPRFDLLTYIQEENEPLLEQIYVHERKALRGAKEREITTRITTEDKKRLRKFCNAIQCDRSETLRALIQIYLQTPWYGGMARTIYREMLFLAGKNAAGVLHG